MNSIDTGKSKFEASDFGEYEILGSTGVIGYEDSYDYEGDFLLTARVGANAGTLYRHSGKVKITDNTVFLQGKNIDFVFYLLDRFDLRKMAFGSGQPLIKASELKNLNLQMPSSGKEKEKIAEYFKLLDALITLHQRKLNLLNNYKRFEWEQRKLGDVVEDYVEKTTIENQYPVLTSSQQMGIVLQDDYFSGDRVSQSGNIGYFVIPRGYFAYRSRSDNDVFVFNRNDCIDKGIISYFYPVFKPSGVDSDFLLHRLNYGLELQLKIASEGTGQHVLSLKKFKNMETLFPKYEEQERIGKYFARLDQLITLHQRRCHELQKLKKYMLHNMFVHDYSETIAILTKETSFMPELESMIEKKLIDQLEYGDSQWIYRKDLKTEEDLWANFRYILEQNNKDRLDGEGLTDAEFEQVKNQLQFSSFYKAGEWLVGENGKVQVHVQRDTKKLHLVVMNHEHIAGGSSVYQVINQFSALKTDDDKNTPARDRRFDVTLLINGLPMIHIELKNKQHSYMDGFWQIKKYISEGKFTGIFSAVQMFVVSNGVNTKYFSAAGATELNPKFISGWLDAEDKPVADYLDFAKSVLRIPEAHEMIARYTVLDKDAKKLILLRPYQIHAIEAIRDASKRGDSGFVWHTTGSGKTLTSYKATRNLLMDIPSLDKTIFLIDRKDLDAQTTQAFKTYANHDLIEVDETNNVTDLSRKLRSSDRQMIVTTIQKLQILINKRLKEGTPEYNKIRNLKIAFVVDECHRAVTPGTKRLLERFFGRSLWFGFTGTPRFAENPYAPMGDLPRTTEELYGKCLHQYTIQHAIRDNAVLGFQVEHLGAKDMADETDSSVYDNEIHMLKVLEVILNKSYYKLGFQNGKGQTYEGLLTTSSIQQAQHYYELLTKVKNGETSLVIDEKIKQVLPDFPKFAITYSVTENEEGSQVNQTKMQQSLDDYNKMFGTKFDLSQIQGYNANLNKRLARKEKKYESRSEQLDLVIVVDRLLTGFDAPCMSTIFIDRQPMGAHDLIQAFSRTNRIFDKNKVYGQIVTFQAPKLFKENVDNALKLYSAGGTIGAELEEWDEIELAFKKAVATLKVAVPKPEDVPKLSPEEKEIFVKMFQSFDRLFAKLKSFTDYDESLLEGYGITEEEYADYVGHYRNVLAELLTNRPEKPKKDKDDFDPDYELMAYSNTKIDYEYIIHLIQNIVTPGEEETVTPEDRQRRVEEVKQYVEELRKENPKVAEIMYNLIGEIEKDADRYKGQSILHVVEHTKQECIDQVISDFCAAWCASKDDVMYAAMHYKNSEIPNESAIKDTSDFAKYKEKQEGSMPKFKYYAKMMVDLKKTLDEEVKPLIIH